jgi:flagellar hook-associated protein 1 FlgK
MAKISAMMDIGKRSMMNSQTALQTVSHNIANKSTEGYSRQRVDLSTAPAVIEGRIQIGMGNRAASVSRTNNPYLEKQLQKEQGMLGFQNGRAEALTKVEQIYNEQQNKGLNQYVSDFFNAYRELANNPEGITSRQIVREAADSMCKDFQRVHNQLVDVQKDLDESIKQQVTEINAMTVEIANLNTEIAAVENQGAPANDQRDRRDLLLKKLNEKIDIKWAESNTGIVNVSTAGNAILVTGFESMKLDTAENDQGRTQVLYDYSRSTADLNITDRIKGGSIGGALEVRDSIIEDLKKNNDNMALTIAREVNAAHTRGFDRNGEAGKAFFVGFSENESPGAVIKLNEEISRDVSQIASSIKPGAIGDNSVALVIAQMQNRDIMGNGASVDDFYNSQVGKIGVITSRAIKSKEAQQNNFNQLNNIRESISGVSLDEETAKMLEFQKSFDASARIIRTADEIFDTVLNLKRL